MIDFEKISERDLKFKAIKLIDSVLLKVFTFLSNVNLEKTINCFKINENSIDLTFNGNLKLYGLKLETFSNKTVRINDLQTIANAIKLEEHSETMISIVKNNNFESIYLFTLNYRVADEIANKIGVNFLKSYEILNALLHTYLVDVYEIEDNKLVERYLDIKKTEDIDLLYKKFPSQVSVSSFNILKNYIPYQITSFKDDKKFSIIDLLKHDWEGVIHLFFDFNIGKIASRLKILQDNAKIGDGDFSKAYKEISENPNYKDDYNKILNWCFLANGIFFVKNETSATSLQSLLKITAEQRFLDIDKILPRTLLLKRDLDFDMIIDYENAMKYITTSLSKDCLKDVSDDGMKMLMPDFYGIDINGNFFNYMVKNNESPHGLIFGTTGSGKSVATLKIVAQIMGFDYDTCETKFLSDNRKIRYLNVGYTGGYIFEDIYKKCKIDNIEQKIEIISGDVNKLRFSVFEFDDMNSPTKIELDFLTNFFNLMLEVSDDNKNNLISALEEPKLHLAIKKMLEQKAYAKVSVLELQTYGGYEYYVDKILSIKDENGNDKYNLYTTIDEIEEPIADNFKKPTISDLYNYIIGAAKDTNYTEEDKTLFRNLATKIQTIDNFKIFSKYSNLSDDKCFPAYYIDFNDIKSNKKDFVAIGWLLIQSWFKKDKEYALKQINSGKRRPDSFYFIEEAHNFLGIKVFEKLFDVFAREVRKFGIHLFLITQSAEDVSVNFAKLFNTRIFIFSEEHRNSVYTNIRKFNGDKDLDNESREVFDKIDNGARNPNKMLCIMHDRGINAFRLPNPSKKNFQRYLATIRNIDIEEIK